MTDYTKLPIHCECVVFGKPCGIILRTHPRCRICGVLLHDKLCDCDLKLQKMLDTCVLCGADLTSKLIKANTREVKYIEKKFSKDQLISNFLERGNFCKECVENCNKNVF